MSIAQSSSTTVSYWHGAAESSQPETQLGNIPDSPVGLLQEVALPDTRSLLQPHISTTKQMEPAALGLCVVVWDSSRTSSVILELFSLLQGWEKSNKNLALSRIMCSFSKLWLPNINYLEHVMEFRKTISYFDYQKGSRYQLFGKRTP